MLRHLALVGPTASGKSGLAMALARQLPDVELVSVDSMQVYRGMDVGTAKPSAVEQQEVRHHLLDIVDASEDFALTDFQAAALTVVADVERRGKRALLVGGTGLYLQSVIDGFAIPGRFPEVRHALDERATPELYAELQERDPIAAGKVEPGNRRRIVRALEVTVGSGRPFSSFGPGIDAYPPSRFVQLGIWLPRSVGAGRIEQRAQQMVDEGWAEEVRSVLAGSGFSKTARQALGYPEIIRHVEEGWPLAEAVEEIVRRTRAFARRQRVWFRRDPRIVWHGTSQDPRVLLPGLLRDCSEVLSNEGGAVRP
jgi:tRNA dimethylallyltransferase